MPSAGSDMQLAFVGTAVVLAFVHAPQRFAVDLPVAMGVKNADYSAHGVTLSYLVHETCNARRPSFWRHSVVQAGVGGQHRACCSAVRCARAPRGRGAPPAPGPARSAPARRPARSLSPTGTSCPARRPGHFGNAADARGHHRQAAGHRFEHRHRRAFGQRGQGEQRKLCSTAAMSARAPGSQTTSSRPARRPAPQAGSSGPSPTIDRRRRSRCSGSSARSARTPRPGRGGS
jgi:hypothetical protein